MNTLLNTVDYQLMIMKPHTLQACMTVLQLLKACKTSKFLSIEIKIQLQRILQMFA